MTGWAERLVFGLECYMLIGFGFALFFTWLGIGRVDPAARESGLGFRLILLPGATALWPLLLARWARAWRER